MMSHSNSEGHSLPVWLELNANPMSPLSRLSNSCNCQNKERQKLQLMNRTQNEESG